MEDKIEKLAKLLEGVKYYEWSKIRVAIEKMYSSASSKLELDNAEAIQKCIKFEFGSFINNQWFVSLRGVTDKG